MSLHNETTDAPSNRLKLVDNALWINFGIIEEIEIGDGLAYNEPPDWFFPVRHSLGAVFLLHLCKTAPKVVVFYSDVLSADVFREYGGTSCVLKFQDAGCFW